MTAPEAGVTLPYDVPERPPEPVRHRRTWRARDRRGLRRRGLQRRAVAAALVGGGAWLALHELAPAAADTVTAVVASRDITVGEPLGPDNLTTVQLPAGVLPRDAATDVGSLAGERAVVPLGPGEVVTEARSRTDHLLLGAGEDEVAAFVPVADPGLLALLTAGTRVDLLSTADGSALATSARVLTVPGTPDDGWSASVGAGGVLVAVDRAEAARLATGSALPGPSVAVVIRPPSTSLR